MAMIDAISEWYNSYIWHWETVIGCVTLLVIQFCQVIFSAFIIEDLLYDTAHRAFQRRDNLGNILTLIFGVLTIPFWFYMGRRLRNLAHEQYLRQRSNSNRVAHFWEGHRDRQLGLQSGVALELMNQQQNLITAIQRQGHQLLGDGTNLINPLNIDTMSLREVGEESWTKFGEWEKSAIKKGKD